MPTRPSNAESEKKPPMSTTADSSSSELSKRPMRQPARPNATEPDATDPDALGTYVDDRTTDQLPEPNEPA